MSISSLTMIINTKSHHHPLPKCLGSALAKGPTVVVMDSGNT
jgi:hypothetical protein